MEEALLGLETVNEDDESKLKTSKALKLSLYRSPSLILISISSFFQSMGWFVPYMYLAGKPKHSFFAPHGKLFVMISRSSRQSDGHFERNGRVFTFHRWHLRHLWPHYAWMVDRSAESKCNYTELRKRFLFLTPFVQGERVASKQYHIDNCRGVVCYLPVVYNI